MTWEPNRERDDFLFDDKKIVASLLKQINDNEFPCLKPRFVSNGSLRSFPILTELMVLLNIG